MLFVERTCESFFLFLVLAPFFRSLPAARTKPRDRDPPPNARQPHKQPQRQPTMPRALITGATGGIGLQVARNLSDKGWSLLLVGREGTEGKLTRAKEQVQASSSSSRNHADVQAIPCDFASLEQVRQAAASALQSSGGSLDAVLLNAAVWPATVGGPATAVRVGGGNSNQATATTMMIDQTLVVNHLSQLLLARLLLPALRRSSSGGRCVFVSSELHRSPAPLLPLPPATPTTPTPSTTLAALLSEPLPPATPPRAAYAFSKLCNVWMAREMQRRELSARPASRVRFASASPGFVPATGLSRAAAGTSVAAWVFRTLAPFLPFAVSVQEGARRLELALTLSVGEGEGREAGGPALYYSKAAAVDPSAAAMDDAAAAEAWRLSEEAIGGDEGPLLAPLL
jgi:NAD(P)-dependent dehydrogenase (short-subunit alcohol dehydrogenase family)